MCPAGSVGRGLCVSVGAPPRQLGLAGSRLHAQTKPVGQFLLDGGGSVSIVHRTCQAIEPALPPISGPRYFKGVSEADLLARANRALMWGPMPDGSIIFQEGPVVIAKQEAS